MSRVNFMTDKVQRIRDFVQQLPIPKLTFTRWGSNNSGQRIQIIYNNNKKR